MEDFKDEKNNVEVENDIDAMSVPVMKQDDLKALDEAERTLEEEIDIDVPFYNQLKSIVISKPKTQLIDEEDIQIFPDETLEALSNSPKGKRSNDKLKKEREDLEKQNLKTQSTIFKKLPKEKTDKKEDKKKEEKVKEKKKNSDKAAKQALALSAYDSHFSITEDKKQLKKDAKAAKIAAKEQDRLAKINAKSEKKAAVNAEIERLKEEKKEKHDAKIREDVLNMAPVMKNKKAEKHGLKTEETHIETVSDNTEFNPFDVAPIFMNSANAESTLSTDETPRNEAVKPDNGLLNPLDETTRSNDTAVNSETNSEINSETESYFATPENTAHVEESVLNSSEDLHAAEHNAEADGKPKNDTPKLDLGVGTCFAFDTHGESIEDIAYNNMYVPAEIVYDEFGNPDIVQTMNVLVFDRGSEGEIAPEVDTTAKIVRRGLDENENIFVEREVKPSLNVDTVVSGSDNVSESDTAENVNAAYDGENVREAGESFGETEETLNVADKTKTDDGSFDMSAWLSGAEEIKSESNGAENSESAEDIVSDSSDDEISMTEGIAVAPVVNESAIENKNETDKKLFGSETAITNESIAQFNLTNLDEEAKNSIIKTESTEISADVPFETVVSQTLTSQGEQTVDNADSDREENKTKNSEDAALASFHNEIADYERAINEGARAVKEANAESTADFAANEIVKDNFAVVSTDTACKKIEQIMSGEDDDSNWRNSMDKVDENGVVIAPSMAKLAKLPQIIDYFISLKLKRDSYVKIANFLTMAYKKFENSPENLKYVEMSIKKIIPCLMTK